MADDFVPVPVDAATIERLKARGVLHPLSDEEGAARYAVGDPTVFLIVEERRCPEHGTEPVLGCDVCRRLFAPDFGEPRG